MLFSFLERSYKASVLRFPSARRFCRPASFSPGTDRRQGRAFLCSGPCSSHHEDRLLSDKVALKFGKRTEQVKGVRASGCAGIDGFMETLQPDAQFIEITHPLDQIA